MKKVGALTLFILLGLVLTGCASALPEKEKTEVTRVEVHPNHFFDPQCFDPQPVVGDHSAGKIYGAVVPHHLLAHGLIAQVMQKLQAAPPSVVVVVGPNHWNKGERMLTSSWDWQTPFGTVEADQEAIAKLLAQSPVKKDDAVFSAEHSIGNLMPFIKYYLPQAKVVPLILHYDVTKKEAGVLADLLTELIGERGVILASVDFSHYLERRQAEEKDRETMEALKAWDYGQLFKMGNDHLDSPASLATLLLAMERLGLEEFDLVDNTNSGVLLGNDLIETTSYFTLVFIE
jgi:AmmeMemoRadiSam system protein B